MSLGESQWPDCAWHIRGRYRIETPAPPSPVLAWQCRARHDPDRVGHCHQFRRFDFGNGSRTKAGQNIRRHTPPDRVYVTWAFPLLPMLQPLCGYALEGVLDRDFLCGLLGLPLRHRVNAGCQQLAGLGVAFTASARGHIWIFARDISFSLPSTDRTSATVSRRSA